jgi:hypothetical protein
MTRRPVVGRGLAGRRQGLAAGVARSGEVGGLGGRSLSCRRREDRRGIAVLVEVLVPDVAGPGVLCHGGKQDGYGLVVGPPGWESLAVERALKGGVEGLGLRAHRIDPPMLAAGVRE